MKHRTNKKRMFLDETRVLITDKKGRALVCMGSFESAAPKTINSIESSCKPVSQNCTPTQLSRERLDYLKERLPTRIKSLETHEKNGSIGSSQQETLDAFRLALAGMDSEPVAMQNFHDAMEGIGHIRRTMDETFGGLHGTHCEPDVLVECKAICDAICEAYRRTAPPAPVAVPECFVRFHRVIKDRHHGRMPEEVQNAFDECAAMLKAGPVTAVAVSVDVPDQIKFLQQQIKDLEEKIEAMELQSIADSARSDYEEDN